MWQEQLSQVLNKLSARERDILMRRAALDWNKGKHKLVWQGRELVVREETLASIGKSFDITRERVRQLERGVLKKAHDILVAERARFEQLLSSIDALLKERGGAVEENRFIHGVLGLNPKDFHNWKPEDFAERQAVLFIMKHAGHERIAHVPASSLHYPVWKHQALEWEAFTKNLNAIHDMISGAGKPLTEEELFTKVRALLPKNLEISDKLIHEWLAMLRPVHCNTLGCWGLTSWPAIVPKRIGDKIDLVFIREGKPLHFRDITRYINALHIDKKVASEGSVRNELIASSRYVLVGRGMYALKEWGYAPGKVREVIQRVCKAEGRPLRKDEIILHVLKERLVKETTVQAVLSNKAWFQKLPTGEYTVRE